MDQERTQLGRKGELIKGKDRKGRKRNTGSGCHQRCGDGISVELKGEKTNFFATVMTAVYQKTI